MKVLLINPNISSEKAYGKKFKKLGAKLPPLGLCCLAAVLKKEGFTVSIIDANCEQLSDEQILKRLGYLEALCRNVIRAELEKFQKNNQNLK